MTDINTQTPSDEILETMTVEELRAVQQSWLREKEKAVKEVRQCEDVLVKVHMELNKKGEFSEQHQKILKQMRGDEQS
tara:strand:+ start:265 stop:498 length:234 start_codon:yes stop_codon:yes gene_type:complete